MNLTKLTTATIIAISMTISAGTAMSQEKDGTVDSNLNQAEQNVDNTGENLKDAGKSLGNSVQNTGEAAGKGLDNAGDTVEKGLDNTGDAIKGTYNEAEKEVGQAADAIEQKSNWGWLGLLGLLGLFGLVGGNKKTKVVEHRDLEALNRTDTVVSRAGTVNRTNAMDSNDSLR